MKRTLRLRALIVSLLLTLPAIAIAQVGEMRVAIGAHADMNRYIGTFSEGNIGFGGDLFIRWNIVPLLSLHGQFGLHSLGFDVTDDDIIDNIPYYGQFTGTVYAGTTIPRERTNAISVSTYSLSASLNLLPSKKFVPYLFAGVGLMNFDPHTSDAGVSLPNNQRGVYDKTATIFPFGIGGELYVTSQLTANFRAQFHLTSTDFLDDLEDGGGNDAFATAGLGLSYYFIGTLDCDEDGLGDAEERSLGTGVCIPDTDKDRLTDFEEVREFNTDPLRPDTDDDGLTDYQEIRDHDTDPRNPDTDLDDLSDGEEIAHKADPKNSDTDGDRLLDGEEVKSHKTDPLRADTDADALTDGAEVNEHSTNPREKDTDKDELQDGDEVTTHGTNPTVADTDDDALRDGAEIVTYRTDPKKRDTDDDRLTDGEELSRTKTDPLDNDSDDDRVIDGEDACPLIAGVRDRNGCPAPPKVGTITDFPAIYFIKGSDEFDFSRVETDENLGLILAYVNQCPGLRVMIEGHASREGGDEFNQELSDKRAKKVREWLVGRGIDSTKIAGTIGYGSRRNAVAEPDPSSEEAKKMERTGELEAIRKQNRRIAVRVVRTCDD